MLITLESQVEIVKIEGKVYFHAQFSENWCGEEGARPNVFDKYK